MNFLRKPLLPNRGMSEVRYPRSNLFLGATELYALGMAPHVNNTHIKVAHCKTAISTVPKADPSSDSRSKSHSKRTHCRSTVLATIIRVASSLLVSSTAHRRNSGALPDQFHRRYWPRSVPEYRDTPTAYVHMCAKSLLTHASTNTRCTFRHRWSFLPALRESLAAPVHAAARIPVLLIPRAAIYMTPWMQQL